MPYPLAFAKKNINSVNNTSVRPGEYDAVLIDIKPNPKFKEGHAFIFTYDLTDLKTGQKYQKSETIINSLENPRLDAILRNLEDNAVTIENVEDLIGLHEHLDLRYEVVGTKPYCNIVSRKFIDFMPIGCDENDLL